MSSREPGRSPRQVFGGMLRYHREQAGLSRTELARQISKGLCARIVPDPSEDHG